MAYTTLVILGNRLLDDGTMSEKMISRLDAGIKIVDTVKVDKIIVSGGVPNKVAVASEAEKMCEYLVNKGVDKSKIILEDKSNTTKENAKFSVPIIKEMGTTTLILCTSKYHLARRIFNAEKLFRKYFSDGSVLFLSVGAKI